MFINARYTYGSYLQGVSTYTWFAAAPSLPERNKISKTQPVCVEPRDDGYGHLQYDGEDILVVALKLKYESGAIR